MAKFELRTFEFIKKFIQENNVACDWTTFKGVHAFLTQQLFDVAAQAVEQLAKPHPELASQISIVRPSEAGNLNSSGDEDTLESLRIPSAKGAILQSNAASLSPYKLVSWMLEELLDNFLAPRFNLQTNTPVTGLRKESESSGNELPTWILTTPRGQISARAVLLCTNAYTSRLLPAFSDLITPTRGQVAALLPPMALSRNPPARLEHSYVFLGDYPPPVYSRDEYLVQRPLPAGELIFGGGRNRALSFGSGEWRDDVVEEPVSKWLRGKLSPPLDLSAEQRRPQVDASQGNNESENDSLLDASFEWSGIMGFSRDHHPWVGAVPESLGGGGKEGGLWISAGYTGHGMPVAALCAQEVVRQITGDSDEQPGSATTPLPPQYCLTEERQRLASSLQHPDTEGLGLAAMFPGLSSTAR